MGQKIRRLAVHPVGHLRRLAQRVAAGDGGEIGALQLQRHGPPGKTLGLGAIRHLFRQPPDMAVQKVAVGYILIKGRLGRDRLHRLIRGHAPEILAPRKVPETVADLPETLDQVLAVPAGEVVEGTDTGGVQLRLTGRPDAPDHADRLALQKPRRIGPPDDREAARLVEVRGDLGKELVMRQPDGACQPKFLLHPFQKPGEQDGGRRLVQPFGAGQVQKRLIKRQRLHHRRHRVHQRPDLARDGGVVTAARLDDDRLGAKPQRLKHRHRRTHALDPRKIAAGGNDAPLRAADDHRNAPQVRVVALFDAGIEGVAIHMRDGERQKLGMRHDARGPAGRAAGAGLKGRQAIAAERRHGQRIPQSTGARNGLCYGLTVKPPHDPAAHVLLLSRQRPHQRAKIAARAVKLIDKAHDDPQRIVIHVEIVAKIAKQLDPRDVHLPVDHAATGIGGADDLGPHEARQKRVIQPRDGGERFLFAQENRFVGHAVTPLRGS